MVKNGQAWTSHLQAGALHGEWHKELEEAFAELIKDQQESTDDLLFGDLAFPRMRKSKLEGKELFKLSLPLCKPQQRVAFVWTALLCVSALTTIPVLR